MARRMPHSLPIVGVGMGVAERVLQKLSCPSYEAPKFQPVACPSLRSVFRAACLGRNLNMNALTDGASQAAA